MNGPVITRPFAWIVRRTGVGTLLTLTLLLIALGSVAHGLADLVRGLNAGPLWSIAALGVLMGWVLAKSPLPGWLGGLVAFILGTEMLLASVGRLGRPLLALLRSLTGLIEGCVRWSLGGRPPDGAPVALALAELETKASTLLTRLSDWLAALLRGEAGFDPLVGALVWSLALYLTAVWAGWSVRRRDRPLQGLTPVGVLLAASLAYTEGDANSLLPLLGAIWLLAALIGHIARERRWQATGTDFCLELRFDLGLVAITLSLALVMTAVLVPTISVRPVYKFVRRLIVEQLGEGKQVADSLGLEPLAGNGAAFDRMRAAALPHGRLIGSGPELSRQVVMVIYLAGPGHTGPPGTPPPRYYWRGLTYDHYTGRGWRTGELETLTYRAGEPAISTTLTAHQMLRQEVQAADDLGGLLYVAGELVTADQDYSVAWRSPDDAFGAQIDAAVYRADSLVPVPSEAQLRAAGSDYPQWVLDRYLTLPDGVSERVLSLALDLTALEPTPYDQARAIETYLRAFPYTLDLPAPPPNREIADYFLFELQRGYCDYYATAMVVLARAAGLPARLATGYASGTYDAVANRFVVTAANAHSWVEIYFPGYGWVEFEPTGGRAPIERPPESVPLEEPPAALQPLAGAGGRTGWLVLLGPLGALVALTLAGFVWRTADDRRLRRMSPALAVEMLYQRLYRHGRRLAVPVEVGSTPHEFAAGLAGRVLELAPDRRQEPEVSFVIRELRWLTDLYVRGLYSPHAPRAVEQTRAIRAWRRLRRQLWLAWLRQLTKRGQAHHASRIIAR